MISPATPSPASAPSTTDLFTQGDLGYFVHRIPGLVVAPKTGTILAYCEGRTYEKHGDWGQTDVLLRRSLDGGQTWDPARKIAHVGKPVPLYPGAKNRSDPEYGNDQAANNPVAIADGRSGCVHFLYCVDYHNCFYMRSDDDGVTFSEPVEITSAFEGFKKSVDWKIIATGPGHGIQLRNGRLIVPVWISPAGSEGYEHRPNTAAVLFSDDFGVTWQAGDIVSPLQEQRDLNETAVVELSDGRVMLNMRNYQPGNRRLVSTSLNGHSLWSKPEPLGDIWEPICMAGMLRLTFSSTGMQSRLLYSGPAGRRGRPDGRPGIMREDLTIRLSYDEGLSWPVCRQIAAGFSGYSDLAVTKNGMIFCFFETKNEKDSFTLTLARFPLEWLTDGRDALQRHEPVHRSEGGDFAFRTGL